MGEPGNAGSAAPGDGGRIDPVRVFISYAHDDLAHEEHVREFWTFLRAHGVDARLDKPAAERRRDWPLWMLREAREARFMLVAVSPAYRQRAEGEAPAGEGLGVQWEAALIREEVYTDREAALDRFIPVVLPGCSQADIPVWLGRGTSTNYAVPEFTVAAADRLLRLLTDQPYETEPPLGQQLVLAPRSPAEFARRPGLRTELLIHTTGDGTGLVADVALAGPLSGPLEVSKPNPLPKKLIYRPITRILAGAVAVTVAATISIVKIPFDSSNFPGRFVALEAFPASITAYDGSYRAAFGLGKENTALRYRTQYERDPPNVDQLFKDMLREGLYGQGGLLLVLQLKSLADKDIVVTDAHIINERCNARAVERVAFVANTVRPIPRFGFDLDATPSIARIIERGDGNEQLGAEYF